MGSPNTFNYSQIAEKWYAYWLANHYFHSEPDSRKPYTIVIPPPNVTGVLHMGHMMNNTFQDVLIRAHNTILKTSPIQMDASDFIL